LPIGQDSGHDSAALARATILPQIGVAVKPAVLYKTLHESA
jgi:hypothetical protein